MICSSRIRYRSCASRQSWAASSGSVSRSPIAQPLSVVEALVPPAVEDADVRDAVLRRLHARCPRRLERPARVVEPDVDALDQEAPDLHVVVLEDVDPAAQLRRARALEDLLDDPLARPVGRVGLAGEDDLDRALLVPQHPRQALDVAEQQPGPLVGREAPREADRQDVRVERRLELGQDRRRLAVARELAAQAAAREVGELALLAEVRLPQVAAGDPLEALPEAAALRAWRRDRRDRRRGPRAARRSAGRSRSGRGCRW